MVSTEQLIYFAGFVDGEGCLTSSKDYRNGRYRPALRVSNTNKAIMDWTKSVFGGNYYTIHRGTNYTKTSYEWVLSTNQAIRLIERLLPYLKIKKREAEVFVSFFKVDVPTSIHLARELSALKHKAG